MRRLFVADVHANLPAFQAVLDAAGAVDRVVFLGDVVGYGPHPNECVGLLRSLDAIAILGNHDRMALEAVTAPHPFFRPDLPPEAKDYLRSLPRSMDLDRPGAARATLIHEPPSGGYLHPDMPDETLAEAFQDVPGESVLGAHCHYRIERVVRGRSIVCLRAVGQPRDGDPRAGYAVEEDGRLTHYRTEYDVERVVRDLRPLEMPAAFRERWTRFVVTGFDQQWSRPFTPMPT